MVGGATSVLTLALDRRRAAGLVVALAALVAYGAAAASLPDVSTNVDAFHSRSWNAE